jgi:ketose-bisphosphate aldolase
MKGAKPPTLRHLLPMAQAKGYAVGSFSPRYPRMIAPVLKAGEALHSPLIVQISHKDMKRCGVAVERFAEAFFATMRDLAISVPVALHLDHTEDIAMIRAAIEAGFSSVMIDASAERLEHNITRTRAVVELARPPGVSVEGELGTIGAFGFSETEANDEASKTDPEQVEIFVEETGIDALAVSVGTVHGVRAGTEITIDVEHLAKIRARTTLPLVLHGGSGIKAEVMQRAIRLPQGGVSKVNLATDLEVAMLHALESRERLVDAQIEALSKADLIRAQAAVEAVVRDKITYVLGSKDQASHYSTEALSQ